MFFKRLDTSQYVYNLNRIDLRLNFKGILVVGVCYLVESRMLNVNFFKVG